MADTGSTKGREERVRENMIQKDIPFLIFQD
jgi:hypothetical protein